MLTYHADQRVLVACGSWDEDDQSCYQLSPGQPSGWQPLGAGQLMNQFCPQPTYIRSHPLEVGWFLIGQKDHCGSSGAAMTTELLTPQLQWIQTQIMSPYDGGYPDNTCSVAVNSSTVIVTGGWIGNGRINSTWMLDLTDFTWTQLQDMPHVRAEHGCTTTPTGEIIIAGGYAGSYLPVYIYNPASNTWSQADDLPDEMTYSYPVMILWNNLPIILEYFSSNIWILDGTNWTKMEATMGAEFRGDYDTATTVPAGLFSC